MLRSMHLRRTMVMVASIAISAGSCGGGSSTPKGPFDAVPASETIKVEGLDGPVDIVRDQFGVPHVHATTLGDAAYASGWIVAHDRILEMNLLRAFATGTVGELFGALDPGQIDTDLEMRMHRMKPLAEETWAMLSQSSDPLDQEIATGLSRYADGVNAFVAAVAEGDQQLADDILVWFDPTRFTPWTPADSLAIGRLQAWSLSWDDADLWRTERFEAARAMFDESADAERARRAGAYFDLFPTMPLDPVATIDGWPNVGADTGTRAREGRRPRAPLALLTDARRALAPKTALAARINDPENGSNNWVVGPSLGGGKALLANDPHLQLSNPSVFYLIHMTVPGQLETRGVAFPGIPGIVLGHNARIAWGSTTVNHDVTDFYLEDIQPCSSGNGDCVTFDGAEVAIETWDETIRVGALGTITEEFTVTYERIPHHGPIIPRIEGHRLAPRTGSQAISVRYTGHEPTMELRAIYGLYKATSVAEAFEALDDFGFGGQNWVVIDDAGDFGWTSTARIPWRETECFSYHEATNPDGVAPFLLLPGDGTCEWEGWMDERYIPHAISPEKGFLATANQDPVGETHDGDALNGPLVDERPLYVGSDYDHGYRNGRITRRLEALDQATLDDMASIQADAHSNYGEAMRPHVIAAAAALAEELATPGTHPDLSAFAGSLTEGQASRIADAAARLAAWSLDTPAAVEGAPTAGEIADSAATTIFNAWAVSFLGRAFGDEMSLVGSGSGGAARIGLFVFTRAKELRTGIADETGEALLCDRLGTAEVESCTYQAVRALADALEWSEDTFGSANMDDWRWGELHTLTLSSLVPDTGLDVPTGGEFDTIGGGFPRHGDNFSVDASSPGLGDFDFTYGHGPSMRHLVELGPGGPPKARIALPGGQVHDPASPHYRDLMEQYWRVNAYFDLAWTTEEILGVAEDRIRLTP